MKTPDAFDAAVRHVRDLLERGERLAAIRYFRRLGFAFRNAKEYVDEIGQGCRWWHCHFPPQRRKRLTPIPGLPLPAILRTIESGKPENRKAQTLFASPLSASATGSASCLPAF